MNTRQKAMDLKFEAIEHFGQEGDSGGPVHDAERGHS